MRTIENNLIFSNYAGKDGGGIYINSTSSKIVNNTVFKNTASDGGGIYCDWGSNSIVTNTILWDNSAISGSEISIGHQYIPSSLSISYSDLKRGSSSVHVEPGCTFNVGSGMIDADPLFLDPADEDFHLTYPSPCRDGGDNSAVVELCDFEGDPRISYGVVDMGADEFCTHLYWTGDATPGGNVEMKFVGIPGTTPVQLWLGYGVLDPPWPTKYGDWHLQFPLLATIPNLGVIPSNGVLVLPLTFPVDTPTPLSLPFQSGIGMELTNLSVMEVE